MASSSGGSAMDITYSFVDPATHGNDGSVYGITNNLNNARSQIFGYDSLNRLTSAGTTSTSGQYCWGYQFPYDAWGNLLAQNAWTPNYDGCTESMMGAVTADPQNHISAFSYDPSGNALSDGTYAYTWNGESELSSGGGVNYAYDGNGNRVSKSNGKFYWYGNDGEILAETDASGNTLNEYVFFNGQRIAMLPSGGSPIYYAEDFLDPSRVNTTSTGTVCYDADFYPFGGERPYTDTCSQNYKFEGKERDTETQNDDFGARYYSWRFGRWLSSDWSDDPEPVPYANFDNPQTLNLYSMVQDDPESFADLDGHQCGGSATGGIGCTNFDVTTATAAGGGNTAPVPAVKKSWWQRLLGAIFGGGSGGANSSRSESSGFGGGGGGGFGSPESEYSRWMSQLKQDFSPQGPLGWMTAAVPEGDVEELFGLTEEAGEEIWTSTKTMSREDNALDHWNEHRAEFPEYQNAQQYVQGAREFVNDPPAGTLTKVRPNGDTLFYNPESNTFAVRARNGAIRTMFRPRDGMAYWSKQ